MRRPLASVGRRSTAEAGFTLLEALIVLGITAILAAIAVPQFSRLIATWRVASNVEALSTAVDLARAEAIGRNTMVQLCRTADPRAETPSCSSAAAGDIAGDDWASGWIVYARPQGVETPAAFTAGTDELVRRFEADGASGTTRSVVKTNTGNATLAFTAGALRNGGQGNERLFMLDYRDPVSTTLSPSARCLTISMIGKVRTGMPTSAGGCNVS